jgi:hypothetical protein
VLHISRDGQLRQISCRHGDRVAAAMADLRQVSEDSLAMQRRAEHHRMVAHDRPGMHEHAEQCQTAHP